MNTGIYAIENTVNGKMYVGSAVNIGKRKTMHLRSLRKRVHHSLKLQRAYDKHGEEAFAFRPLLICRKEDLLFYEQSVLDKFDTARAGYNIAPVAGSSLGIKRSEETKAKIVEAVKARWADPEYNAAGKARWADPEYKARLTVAMKTGWADPARKAKQGERSRVLWADPEYKARLAAASKARWADPEYKARLAVAMKVARDDPEFKAKHAAAMADPEFKAKMKIVRADPEYKANRKAMWADPEYKVKHAAAMKIARADPEYRAKQSVALKAYHATKRKAA